MGILGMPWHAVPLRGTALSYYLTFGSIGDAVLLATFGLWRTRKQIWGLLGDNVSVPVGVAVSVTIAASIALFLFQLREFFARTHESAKWTGPTKPLLFPCGTTHTRFFPKKHSFVYSYLMVGIPVGWEGVSGGMISAGQQESSRKGWYQIYATDYLERGNGHLGLRGKLDAYLRSQGADPAQYPHAYLVTAAKFLGYHFNPVSFWYLYSAEKNMTAMVLEVNNTFDERRMYYLTSNNTTTEIVDVEGLNGEDDIRKDLVKDPDAKPLRRAWPKDFHVSPFNSRKGGYTLVAHDPFAPMLEGHGSIKNTIHLISSKNHAKLVARIFSQGAALDPATMSSWQKLKFLSVWWWVGLVTFPRIVKEAGLLFFKRKLHVWYRPEPLKQSLGRRAVETERQLELVFRRYLRQLVSLCPASLVVNYIPSGLADAPAETMRSPSAQEDSDSTVTEEIEFKVLTPVFYSRFVYYAHDLEAVFCELNDNCTIWVSRPDLLPKLVFKKPPPTLHTSSYLDYGYFKLIQRLRQRPERIVTPMTSSQTASQSADTYSKTDIREFRLSSMDGYVLAHEDTRSRILYRSLVLRLFLADRLAMGSVELLWLEQFAFRVLLAWIVIG